MPEEIVYYDGTFNKVDCSTKSSVSSAINKLKQKIDSCFFDNLRINVSSNFSNLDEHSIFSKALKNGEVGGLATKGITSDTTPREIFINESAFWCDKIKSINFRADEEIESATLHEMGHNFDFYYGTSEELKKEHAELVLKYDSMPEEELALYNSGKKDITDKEKAFIEYYRDNNGYSDKKDFKQAILEDAKTLRAKINFFEMNFSELAYYVCEFYEDGAWENANSDLVDKADMCRGEVFAQLFAYANGAEDSYKELFLELFPKTFEVVNKYIELHKKQ